MPVLVSLGIVTTAVASLGAPLLPTIVRADRVSVASSQWALTIALIAGAVATPVLGRLGDGCRRRRVTLLTAAATAAGCVLSALPAGFAWLLAGRALQGTGLALVPLAIAIARDALPDDRVAATIALLGVTTAVGIGIGYPLAGLIVEHIGLGAAFWFGAAVSGLALLGAAIVLPPSPTRPGGRVDVPGALLLGASVTGLLVVLADGQSWGWTSAPVLTIAAVSPLLLAGWAMTELRRAQPLIDLRVARHRPVLAANTTVLLVGCGIYPLLPLVSRLVQTPAATGYGFGSSAVVAGVMLAPFSAASFGAGRVATRAARLMSPELVVALSCAVLIAAMGTFLAARNALWEIAITMALAGFGTGCVFASNPLQIARGTRPGQTASAMGFYQVVRSLGFSAGSALSATVLVRYTPRGQRLPASAGYSAAAWVSIAVLLTALLLAGALAAWDRAARATGAPPGQVAGSQAAAGAN